MVTFDQGKGNIFGSMKACWLLSRIEDSSTFKQKGYELMLGLNVKCSESFPQNVGFQAFKSWSSYQQQHYFLCIEGT